MRVWAHDRFSIPLPGGHRFPVAKYARAARARRGRALGDVVDVPAAAPWEDLAARARRRRTSSACAPGRSACARAAASGCRGRRELVERGRRSSQGTVEAARDALRDGCGHEPRRRHAPRRAGRRPRLLPVQRRGPRGARPARRRRARPRRSSSTATSTRATAPPQLCADDPETFTLSIHGARQLPVPPRDVGPRRRPRRRGTGDDEYLERARARPARGDPGRAPRARRLPGRRRPVGGRLARPPLADEGRAARARRARHRHRRRDRRRRCA